MKKKNRANRHNSNSPIRRTLAREAAAIMYHDGVKQYFDAKRMANKRLLSRGGSKSGQCRPKDLPSNGEISAELAKLVELLEDDKEQRLLALREAAVGVMRELQEFSPRLIGSVSTGRIRKGSDIDLHVFTEHIELLESALQHLQWFYEKEQVIIKKGAHYVEYTHIYLQADFPIELSVYPCSELKVVSKSSTDGRPIRRLKLAEVEALC